MAPGYIHSIKPQLWLNHPSHGVTTPPVPFHFKPVTQTKQTTQNESTVSPGLHITKPPCWNPTLLFPPRCHTLSERLALMWLAAIQLYERNEQMWLLPPITIFHLALQSPPYSSARSTFSLHFPFSSPDRDHPPVLLRNIFKSSLKNVVMRAANPGEILCSDKSNAASVSTRSQSSEAQKTIWADILRPTHIHFVADYFFFLFTSKLKKYYQLSALKKPHKKKKFENSKKLSDTKNSTGCREKLARELWTPINLPFN